jgi:hypothetical protein
MQAVVNWDHVSAGRIPRHDGALLSEHTRTFFADSWYSYFCTAIRFFLLLKIDWDFAIGFEITAHCQMNSKKVWSIYLFGFYGFLTLLSLGQKVQKVLLNSMNLQVTTQ